MGEVDCPTPLSMLLPMPTAHSMPMPAGSPAPGILFGQHVQPLSPFPMGDSPALGSGYTAPQNTPAAGTASGLGSSRQFSLTPSPYQPAESAGSVRLITEGGAMAGSPPAEAPGVQDLLAAFRRAVGQHRAPPASPAPALPDTPGSLVGSPDHAASSPGVAASQAQQPLPETPEAVDQQLSGTGEPSCTGRHRQDRLIASAELELEEQAGTAAVDTLQDDGVGGSVADEEAVPDSTTASESPNKEADSESGLAPAAVMLAQEAVLTEAASPAAESHGAQQAAEDLSAAETCHVVPLQQQRPEATSQVESDASPLTPPGGASPPAEEVTAQESLESQDTDLQERLAAEGLGPASEERKSSSKASRQVLLSLPHKCCSALERLNHEILMLLHMHLDQSECMCPCQASWLQVDSRTHSSEQSSDSGIPPQGGPVTQEDRQDIQAAEAAADGC